MKSALLVAAVLAVTGCATATNQNIPFVEAASAPAGSANLYIYRTQAPPYIYQTEIKIDGKLVGKLSEGNYAAYPIALGKHSILLDSFDWPDVAFDLLVENSSDLFIKFTGSATTTPGGGNVLLVFHANAAAYRVDAPIAVAEITGCCRFVPASR